MARERDFHNFFLNVQTAVRESSEAAAGRGAPSETPARWLASPRRCQPGRTCAAASPLPAGSAIAPVFEAQRSAARPAYTLRKVAAGDAHRSSTAASEVERSGWKEGWRVGSRPMRTVSPERV